MAKIKIVSGLNYGDESKGLVANAISTSNCLNVLPSNSCQRAHTVVENGVRRVFRHFGSGTLKGAATYFSGDFIVNPAMFRQEYTELVKTGVTPTVYCNTKVRIATVVDMYANCYLERLRGNHSFSSTGCGVYETIMRDKYMEEEKPIYILPDIIEYYKHRLAANNNGVLDDEVKDFLEGKALKQNHDDDLSFFYNHCIPISTDEEEKELFHSYPLIVFENGQGLLLTDEYCIDSAHNTPASVGLLHPKNLIFKNFDNVEKECQIENYYVSRTYLTRHGKGQIGMSGDCECGKEDINPNMVDKTNVPNPNQGVLRYGKFSTEEAELAMERIEEDTVRHLALISQSNLVITHTNEYNDGELERAAKKFRIRTFLSDNETSFKLKEKF